MVSNFTCWLRSNHMGHRVMEVHDSGSTSLLYLWLQIFFLTICSSITNICTTSDVKRHISWWLIAIIQLWKLQLFQWTIVMKAGNTGWIQKTRPCSWALSWGMFKTSKLRKWASTWLLEPVLAFLFLQTLLLQGRGAYLPIVFPLAFANTTISWNSEQSQTQLSN